MKLNVYYNFLSFFKRTYIIIIFLLIENVYYVNCDDNSTIIVNIPKVGLIKGSTTQSSWTNQTIYQFLGIPYAESPSGNLRFKAPVVRSKWNGIFDATKTGRPCPSITSLSNKEENKNEDIEDCLNLYVYTKNTNQKRPVMVYIHGGALSDGSAIEYRSNYLLEKDIVLVVIQYRLGALGFLSTRTQDIPGNMGILDSIFALEWINQNIEYFGGDISKVTIFGESAGGCITSLLSVTPKVRNGLFQRVILQSGSMLVSAMNRKDPINDAKQICNELKCENCDIIKNANICLRSASVSQLVRINSIIFGFTTLDYYGVMPEDPHTMIEDANFHYPFMAGINKYDGAFLFKLGGMDVSPRQYLRGLIKNEDNYSGILGNLLAKMFFQPQELDKPKIDVKGMMPNFIDILSTIVFKSPIQTYLELYLRKSSENNNFLYAFDYEGEHNFIPLVDHLKQVYPIYPFTAGPHHADDLLYLFPWTKELNLEDTEMAKLMIDLWTSFAINGIPETKIYKEIPKLINLNGPYFHIDKQITIGNIFSDEFFIATSGKDKF